MEDRRTADYELKMGVDQRAFSAGLLSAMIEGSLDALVVTDAAAIIVWCNQAFTTLTGYSAEEAIGKNPRMLQSGQTPPTTYEEMWRKLRRGEAWRGHWTNRRKDGTIYIEETSITPVMEGAQAAYFVSFKRELGSWPRDAAMPRQIEALHTLVWEQSGDAMRLTDSEGVVIKVNAAYCALAGKLRQELEGKPFSMIYALAEREHVLDSYCHRFADRTVERSYEREMTFWDGRSRRVEVTTCFLVGTGLPFVLSTFRDSTVRHEAERSLRESVSLLHATLESTADGILVVDTDRRVTSYNQRFLDIWGIPEVLILSRDTGLLIDFVQEQLANPAQFREQTEKMFAHPKDEAFTLLRFKDGRVVERHSRPQRIGAETVGRVCSFRDVGQRFHAEEQLRASEERWQLVLRGNNDGWWDWNAKTNEIFCSDRCHQILGFEGAEFPNTADEWRGRIHSADSTRVLRAINEYVGGKVPFFAIEYRLLAKDETYRWVLSRGQAVWDADGQPLRMVGSLTDISERKLAEEAAKGARVAAEAASVSKGEFLANMSHEIRTPLNGVIGMIDLALAIGLPAEQEEYLEMASGSAHTLLSLLGDILDLSKIEAGRMELTPIGFSMRECVADTTKPFLLQANSKGIEFRTIVEPEVPGWVVGDLVRFRQVLVNLLGNAIKFTDKGHVIARIALESISNTETVVRCEVNDTGIGIPAGKQQSIFEAFRQEDGSMTRRFGGTGLGLAICTRLISLMGGSIGVKSEQGVGSTFFFTVRFARYAEIETKTSQPPPFDSRALRSLRILIAEDNAVNQRLIAELLKRDGHMPTVVDNGLKAVERAGRELFDAILMDVQMPHMDGFGATAGIRALERATGRRTPIVALTAHTMKGDEERCLEAGMDYYLRKPISLAALREVLARVAVQSENIHS
jgi:PAS domain S-box-containing protein